MFINLRHKIAAFLVAFTTVTFFTVKPVSAAVTGFVVKDKNDGKYYEYNYEELLDSYVLSVLGMDAKLFNHYKAKTMQAFLDDMKGYIAYNDVIDAYTLAVISGKPFNINEYTESGKAKAAQMPAKVTVVSELKDNLAFAEKNLDPVFNALDALNKAASVANVKAILIEEGKTLGLNLDEYNQLNDYGQNYVAKKILENRPSGGYQAAEAARTLFSEQVGSVKGQLQTALAQVNNANSAETMEAAIKINAEALELDLARYGSLAADLRAATLDKLLGKKPFSSVKELKDYFNDLVANIGKHISISYTSYNHTLQEIMDIQMGLGTPPQTDLYGGGWQAAKREDAQYYVDPRNFFSFETAGVDAKHIIVDVGSDTFLRVRKDPNTGGLELTRVYNGETYAVLDTYDDGSAVWYKIQARGYTGWVYGGYVRLTAQTYSKEMLQFLDLSDSANVSEEDMAKILKGRGILEGKEKAFLQGSAANSINEVFLVSLALHESGNGTSLLATGIEFPDKDDLFEGDTVTVYNMYGIGAYDSNPNYFGAERAYKERWFTPEEAIIGGAKFAASNYINNPTYQQNTLYKMRWNPANPGTHQYATDMGWAVKQTGRIQELYDQLSTYTMRFDIPRYKDAK